MLLALVATVAAYDLRIACGQGVDLAGTAPAAGAEGVPVDVRAAVTFVDGCGLASEWSASLTRASDGAEVTTTRDDVAGLLDTHLLELFPAADLEPETAYTFTLTPAVGEVVAIGFTTGTGTVAGLEGTPNVTAEKSDYEAGNTTLNLTVGVLPAADPDGLSIVQLGDAAADLPLQSFVVSGDVEAEHTLVWRSVENPVKACPRVRQIDGAGVATAWSEPDCVGVFACQCGTGGPASLLAAGLAVGFAAARRGGGRLDRARTRGHRGDGGAGPSAAAPVP